MRTLAQTLGLWETELLTDEQVRAWARRTIEREAAPDFSLFALMDHGPEACRKRERELDFDWRAQAPTYRECFALHAMRTPLETDEQQLAFARTIMRCVFADYPLDMSDPLVRLAYQLDHCLNDYDGREHALFYLKHDLPPLLAGCPALAAPWWDEDLAPLK